MTVQMKKSPSRRDFLNTSMAAAASSAIFGGPSLARSVHGAGSDVIRIGLIGSGSRGPGAAVNAMNADPGVRLVAMTDIFAGRVKHSRDALEKKSRSKSTWTTLIVSPAWAATST